MAGLVVTYCQQKKKILSPPLQKAQNQLKKHRRKNHEAVPPDKDTEVSANLKCTYNLLVARIRMFFVHTRFITWYSSHIYNFLFP